MVRHSSGASFADEAVDTVTCGRCRGMFFEARFGLNMHIVTRYVQIFSVITSYVTVPMFDVP